MRHCSLCVALALVTVSVQAAGRARPRRAKHAQNRTSVLAGLDMQGFRLFDMGHPTQPVYPGATQVTAESAYSPGRGFGWLDAGTVGTSGQRLVHRPFRYRGRYLAYSIRPVGDLLVDHVFWRGSDKKPLTFRIDLPDGDYRAAVWTNGMVSGGLFWDYTSFRILAGDEERAAVSVSEADYWRKAFWREADDALEWRPGQSVFKKYMAGSYPCHTFDARATGGRLEIRFAMPLNGLKLTRGQTNRVLPIRAVLVAPASKAEAFGVAVQRLQDEVETRFNKSCRMIALTPQKAAAPLSAHRAKGYVVFGWHLMRRVWPNSLPYPGTVNAPILIRAARGQRESACLALRALREVGPVRVSVRDLTGPGGAVIGREDVELCWLRYLEQPHSYSGRQKDFAYRPTAEILRPIAAGATVEVPKDVTRGFLVAVKPRAAAPAGEYAATIHIEPAGAEATDVPLRITVLPFRLRTFPDDRGRVLYYYGPRWARMFPDEAVLRERVAKDLANCHKYGVEPGYQVLWGTDIKQVVAFMDQYRQHTWLGPLILGGGNLKQQIVARAMARKAGKTVPPAAEYYADAIKWAGELVRTVKSENRPPIAFYVSAEAAQKGMPEILATKECPETLQAAIPGV